MTFQTSFYPLLIYFHPALTESTNLFPQLNSVAERAIANVQMCSLYLSHAEHGNGLLEAPPPVKTLSL
ncbi:MAG: hypothetical protein V7L21_14860 [Nostoc sp.]|uniref:hypothetical protein n=1 Tax=Nostoc sp. TaxID=1180 RepID=UPI002FFCC371